MSNRTAHAKAPAKAILLGEHAVVYGFPAIAVPLPHLYASATASLEPDLGDVVIEAKDIRESVSLGQAPEHPLALAARLALEALGIRSSNLRVTIESNIPIASGLGSGAAVSTAIMRSLATLFQTALPADRLSALVYEVEKLYHGTPSGIDNTVVVHERPLYFRKGHGLQFVQLSAPLLLAVAHTGVASNTREVVAAVRAMRERDSSYVDSRLAAIGRLVEDARRAMHEGDLQALGRCLDRTQTILAELRISSPELDRLVDAARRAGALGAKLTGAGRGGSIIALVTKEKAAETVQALQEAGAKRVTLCPVPEN